MASWLGRLSIRGQILLPTLAIALPAGAMIAWLVQGDTAAITPMRKNASMLRGALGRPCDTLERPVRLFALEDARDSLRTLRQSNAGSRRTGDTT